MEWLELLIKAIPEWFEHVSGNPSIVDIIITAIPDFLDPFIEIVVTATPDFIGHNPELMMVASGFFLLFMAWHYDLV